MKRQEGAASCSCKALQVVSLLTSSPSDIILRWGGLNESHSGSEHHTRCLKVPHNYADPELMLTSH